MTRDLTEGREEREAVAFDGNSSLGVISDVDVMRLSGRNHEERAAIAFEQRTASCFYVCRNPDWQLPGSALIKIGIARSVSAREAHHRSSFAGWVTELAVQSTQARIVEDFWKRYFKPWSYRGSREQFVIPDAEFCFLLSAPVLLFSEGLRPWDPDALRRLDYSARLQWVFQGCFDTRITVHPKSHYVVLPSPRKRKEMVA